MSESKFNEEKQDVREMIENIKQMSDIDKAKVQGVMLGMKMAKETPGKTAQQETGRRKHKIKQEIRRVMEYDSHNLC